jgi:hypothetical protein
MQCFQLVGSKRSHVINLPFSAYQSCKANGTVADLDDPNYAHWPGSTAAPAPAPVVEPVKPDAGALEKEANLGLTIPLLMPENGLGPLELAAIDRPMDAGPLYVREFRGDNTVPDGVYCERGWPPVIEFAIEFLNDDAFKIDSEGRLELSLTNGIALYRPVGVWSADQRLLFAEFLEGDFVPIPETQTGEQQPSQAGDVSAKSVDIPADWMDQHHNWKRARAAEISSKAVGSKAEAEKIIKAYLEAK